MLNFGNSPVRHPLSSLSVQRAASAAGGAGGGPDPLAPASPLHSPKGAIFGNVGDPVDPVAPAIEIDAHKVGLVGGKYVAVKNHTNINESPCQRAQVLIQAHKTYTGDDFIGGRVPLGVFTFLVAVDVANARQPYHLLAKEVRSVLELGTRHNSIAKDASLGIRRILCGGEIQKTAEGLRFNLQSGHYTVTRFKELRKPLKGVDMVNAAAKSVDFAAAVQTLLPTATYVPFSPDVTFIKEEALPPLDEAELHLYTSCGLSVFLFSLRRNAELFQRFERDESSPMSEEEAALEKMEELGGERFEPEVTVGAEAAGEAAEAAGKDLAERVKNAADQLNVARGNAVAGGAAEGGAGAAGGGAAAAAAAAGGAGGNAPRTPRRRRTRKQRQTRRRQQRQTRRRR